MERKWFENTTGECPVAEGVLVDVKYRGSSFDIKYGIPALQDVAGNDASESFWKLDGMSNDIVRWRHAEGVDGWISNVGNTDGICPVDGSDVVETMLTDGEVLSYRADGFYWDYNTHDECSIERYRAYTEKVEEVTPEDADKIISLSGVDVLPIGVNPKQGIGSTKLPLHLASPVAVSYLALGLANGAGKYGISNFKATPVVMSIYLDATLRHLFALMEGEEVDPVDGVPHEAAIMANTAIIIEARAAGTLIDDRQIGTGYLQERDKLTDIYRGLQELYKDKNPHHYTRNNV